MTTPFSSTICSMAVEVDAHARPVEARRHLLDMRRLAGAVIALDHDAAVVGKARQDRHRGVMVEAVALVDIRHVLAALAEGRHLHLGIEPEDLPHRNGDVRQGRCFRGRGSRGRHLE